MPEQAGSKLARLRQRFALVDAFLQMITKAKVDGERRLAAEITYYAFFSLFPLLMVFVTIVQAAFDQRRSEEILDSVLGQFPVVGNDLVRNVSTPEGRGVAALIGIVLALWAGSHAFESFEHAMRVVWEGPAVAPESLVRSRLRAFVTMAILGAAVLVATIVGSLLAAVTILPGLVKPLSLLVAIALNTGVILLVFRYLDPHRRGWRVHLPGAVVGAVGWAILQTVGAYFVRYVVKGASDVYGTFAVVIGLLTWINIQVRLMLWAAELNSIIEGRAAGELRQPEPKPGEPAAPAPAQ
jgi:inner membrane protein YhjD